MVILTNHDLEQLHVKKAVGIRFETNLLDQSLETYEIVEVSRSGVVVEKCGRPVDAPTEEDLEACIPIPRVSLVRLSPLR